MGIATMILSLFYHSFNSRLGEVHKLRNFMIPHICMFMQGMNFSISVISGTAGMWYVQNVNPRGTISSMWIIPRKCEGCYQARLVRSIEQIR